MAAEGGNIVRYIYRGEEGEVTPREATHITIAARNIPPNAFRGRHNIIEVICHEDVERIGQFAFCGCPRLRRVIMPGVKIVEWNAFLKCEALEDVECGKVEIIGATSFASCESLRSINIPSARIVGNSAFGGCKAAVDVKFGSKLEEIASLAFNKCSSLERITLPLKDGFITGDDKFTGCEQLKHIDLVEGAELHETFIAALQLKEWRIDLSYEIGSINWILPNARAGGWGDEGPWNDGEKARVIRKWIRSVREKINRYKAQHSRILDDAETTLQLVLPQDIATNNILPFLALPSYSLEGGI